MKQLILVNKKIKQLQIKKQRLKFERETADSLGFTFEYQKKDDEINATIGMIDHLQEIKDDIEHFMELSNKLQEKYDQSVDELDHLEKQVSDLHNIIQNADCIDQTDKELSNNYYLKLNRVKS